MLFLVVGNYIHNCTLCVSSQTCLYHSAIWWFKRLFASPLLTSNSKLVDKEDILEEAGNVLLVIASSCRAPRTYHSSCRTTRMASHTELEHYGIEFGPDVSQGDTHAILYQK
jgi:hypothetical protein